MRKKLAVVVIMIHTLLLPAFSQTKTNQTLLNQIATDHKEKEIKNFQKALVLSKEKGWALIIKTKNGGIATLIGVDDAGLPIYYSTDNNIVAAATTRTNLLWPGGSLGLNLSGSSASIRNKLAIWDGGKIRDTHVELTGRVTQKDNPSSLNDHATHVTGTMMAAGVNPNAKGMAFGYQSLLAYDFTNDVSEMFGEAAGLALSNHSYGTIAGWFFNETENRWEFYGRFNENEDYKFGYYDSKAQLWDSIAYNAPFYLITKSIGNNRSENGPAEGQPYFRYNSSGQMAAAGNRPAGISNNDSYDIVSANGNAKNILTVGAVNGLPYGYNKKEDVVLTNFSSWGPTDDGRIKPDVVADGVNILSSYATSDNAYASISGTSMATPNVTGSLLLLQEYYTQLHSGNLMRSATLKALAIHTADEAGASDGPDYQYGWGLLNTAKAAEVIKSNNAGSHFIYEHVLSNAATFTTNIVTSGQGPLVATIVWTDPKASVEPLATALNNRTRKLVNDLDIKLIQGSTTYLPWILDPNSPASVAVRGDNVLDNVEKINVNSIIPGQTYTIQVTHKGTLERGSQAYSLIISGAGGQAYCASAPSSSGGARIESVVLGSINKTNPAGCTAYNNFTNISTPIQPNQTIPFTINLGSCDAGTAGKVVKIYIDYNNNGSFTDAGELVATSGIISGNGAFTGSITTPANLPAGNTAILRIVAQETSNPADVNPCGIYSKGETQDYLVTFAAPSNDLALLEVTAPSNGSCPNPAQLIAVKIKNNGTVDRTNVPLTVIVKNGATTVATLTATYPGSIIASDVTLYTFQTPFNAVSGATYTLTAIVGNADDQNKSNDTLTANIAIAATPPTPSGTAEICATTAVLKVNSPVSSANYFWYPNATTDSSIVSGASVSTAIIPPNNTYYLGSGARGTVGLPAKSAYPNGGGYLTSGTGNYMKFNASVPVILESARLYIKYPGKINFIVANIVSTTSTGYTYQALSSTTIDVYATSPTPAPGAQAVYDAADNGAEFYLNLNLPAGEHAIIVQPIGSANIFRNNNVSGDPYPFTLPNVISFTGNSASSPNNFQNFYYFLYNMKVRTPDCISNRAAVVASVLPTPTITQVNDSLMSSAASGNQWYLNGSPITGATDKKYKPAQSGSYTVMITGNSGCQLQSAAFNFVLDSVVNINPQDIELKVSPNPNSGLFVINFKVNKRDDLKINLFNMQGQNCYSKTYSNFIGTYTEQLNLKRMASGVYLLRLQHDNKFYHKKIVIQP